MPKDNWTFVNVFRGKEADRDFSKPDEPCPIGMTDTRTGMVKVAIAVGSLGEKRP
jgi:hypothetical protein